MENERPENGIKKGVKEVAKEVIGWEDNKLFLTLKYLTTKPGQIISGYSSGEKHKYLSPVAYYFGVESLKSYLMSVSGLSTGVLGKLKDLKSIHSSNDSLQTANNVNDTLSGFFTFFLSEIGQKIIALPLLLILTWLFYKKYNKNIKDNCWFAFYTTGHAALLTVPLIPLWYLANGEKIFATSAAIITISYYVWASLQFYNLRFGKALVLRILFYVTVWVFLFLITIFIVFIELS